MMRRLLLLSAAIFAGSLASFQSGTAVANIANPCAVVNGPAAAVATVSPTLCVAVDGQSQEFELPFGMDGKSFRLNGGTQIMFEGGNVQLVSVAGNVDPFFNFVFSIQDIGAPSSFALLVSAPLIPALPDPLLVKSSLGITMTDGGSDGITLTPTFSDIGLFDIDAIPAGVDLGCAIPADATGDPCPLVGAAGTTTVFGSYTATALFMPGLGPYGSMSALIAFSGSGGDDVYGITGRFDVTALPEPTALALLGLGLIGVGVVRRRRWAR